MTEDNARRRVFITGGTGFMGRRLIADLLERGHTARALVPKGSSHETLHECRLGADALEGSGAERSEA